MTTSAIVDTEGCVRLRLGLQTGSLLSITQWGELPGSSRAGSNAGVGRNVLGRSGHGTNGDAVSSAISEFEGTELVGDATRAREELGWAPTVDFAEIVRRMVAADLA